MKLISFVLSMALMASVSAVEVTATGSGANEKQAIQEAKNNALEQVTGAFIVNNATSDGRSVKHQSDQYSGGYVKKYKVTSVNDYGSQVEVSIVADVDPGKNNGMIVPAEVDFTEQSIKLHEVADRHENIERMGRSLDDKSKAFVAVKPKLEMLPQGETTLIRITAGVVLQPKWIDDVKQWSKQAGSPIDVSTQTSDVLWVIGTATAPFAMVGSSIVRSAANFTTPVQQNYTESNCFSPRRDKDVTECYAIGYMMGNVVQNGRFIVRIKLWSGNTLVQELPVAVISEGALFAIHDNGSRLYFQSSAKERKFHSRGVVWFTDGIAVGKNEFVVNTRKLANVDRMEYALQ